MILAAGFGKRLQPLTLKTPKALIEVRGRPILDRVIEKLVQHGVDDLIINTHYLHSAIKTYIQTHPFPLPITISHEGTILGTGAGLYYTRDFWDEEDFIVYNVDIICDADLRKMLADHRDQHATVTLAINKKETNSMLLADETGCIVGRSIDDEWQLFGKAQGSIKKVGFCGFQIISPTFWNLISPPMSFSIIDDYMKLLKSGGKICSWSIGDSYWEDIGTPEALERADRHFQE